MAHRFALIRAGAGGSVQVSSLRDTCATSMSCTDADHVARQSNLIALAKDGPYQLTVPHAHGVIVEYFQTTEDALRRQVELDDLVSAAQGFRHPSWQDAQ